MFWICSETYLKYYHNLSSDMEQRHIIASFVNSMFLKCAKYPNYDYKLGLSETHAPCEKKKKIASYFC